MRSILLGVTVSAAVAVGVSACGSSSTSEPAAPPPVVTGDDGGVDAAPPPDAAPPLDNGAPSTTYPAPHPPLPELVNQAGGKVLATPKAYLIFYPGYEHAAVIQALVQAVGATPYWSATTAEYGVGPLGYAGTIELTGETAPATITDKAVEAFLNGKIASGAFGDADPSVVYSIFYPKSTTITLAGGGPLGPSQSCSSFGGYHSNTEVVIAGAAKKNFAFAVLPTCATFAGQSEIDGLTGALSHELVEALRRDPNKERRWVVLVDGEPRQLRAVKAEARRAGVKVTILLDVVHVLEYVWKAARALFGGSNPKAEKWVGERLLALLSGRSGGQVAHTIRWWASRSKLDAPALAAIESACDYVANRTRTRLMNYADALRDGLPISTGVIEGACRYVVKDRMDRTGARWSLTGAEAVLRLRAVRASGDFDAYWAFHLDQEHQRNHVGRYEDGAIPDPLPAPKPRLRRVK